MKDFDVEPDAKTIRSMIAAFVTVGNIKELNAWLESIGMSESVAVVETDASPRGWGKSFPMSTTPTVCYSRSHLFR